MKIEFNLLSLKKAIKNVQKSIPSNPQLPILSSVLINVDKNNLTLAATDLYLGIKTKSELKNNKHKASLVIPGLMLKDLINSFSDEEVFINIKKEAIELESGSSRVKIPAQEPSEYPEFPKVSGPKIEIPTSVLKEVLEMTGYAASLDQVRPILTTIMFDFNKSGLEVATTDGFRLSVLKYPHLESQVKKRLLIPIKSFEEVCRIVDQSDVDVIKIQVDEELKQIKIEVDQNEIFVRLIEGEYPPYKKIIPENFETQVEIDGEILKEELQRAFILARESSNIVKFELRENKLLISSNSPSYGEYSGEILTLSQMDDELDKEIAFDIRYLLDFLNNTNPKEVVFCMNEQLKPASFNIKNKDNFTYIVMPFRVNN
jgi:DNA polymerase-3 subunit beta